MGRMWRNPTKVMREQRARLKVSSEDKPEEGLEATDWALFIWCGTC